MPSVTQPKRPPEYINGKNNQVIAVEDARLLGVSWVDGEGQKMNALVICFGTNTEDKGPGVFVLADEAEMSTQLKIPNRTITKGVRAWLARQKAPSADEVPDNGAALVPADGDEDGVTGLNIADVNVRT